MTTYNFFNKKDLKRFLEFCSYNYKDTIPELVKCENYTDNAVSNEQITNKIKSFQSSEIFSFKNQLYNSIKENKKSLIELQKRIEEQESFYEKIKDCVNIEEVFKVISD